MAHSLEASINSFDLPVSSSYRGGPSETTQGPIPRAELMRPSADSDKERGTAEPVLRVRGLTTHFELSTHAIRAVDGVDLDVARGQTVCLVGESGSGKSATGLSILRLVPAPGRIVEGEITLNGVNLLDLDSKAMEAVRGSEATMVFQHHRAALHGRARLHRDIPDASKAVRNGCAGERQQHGPDHGPRSPAQCAGFPGRLLDDDRGCHDRHRGGVQLPRDRYPNRPRPTGAS